MNEIQKTTKQEEKPSLIIRQMQSQFAKVLPKIITPERFCRVVLSAINKNPALVKAISDPDCQTSVIAAFMRCAEIGLEPDGRRATITCYQNKKTGSYDVTMIPMYQGLSELAMRSGQISSIHADKVCENDDFTWDTGTIRHKINFREPRGNAYAYYCIIRFKDGSVKTETMSLDEVNAIRERSSGYQAAVRYGKTNPWITDPDEMGKKTVFRRCAKWLPLSPEQQKAFDYDNEDFNGAKAVNSFAADKFAQAVGLTNDDTGHGTPAPDEDSVIDVPAEPAVKPDSASETLFDDKK